MTLFAVVILLKSGLAFQLTVTREGILTVQKAYMNMKTSYKTKDL